MRRENVVLNDKPKTRQITKTLAVVVVAVAAVVVVVVVVVVVIMK